MLLDESFANLDTVVRGQLRNLVRRLHDRTGIPVIIVSHDREDVLDLADHLVVMAHGASSQQGPTPDIVQHPTTRISAQLVGVPNILTVHRWQPQAHDRLAITDWGPFTAGQTHHLTRLPRTRGALHGHHTGPIGRPPSSKPAAPRSTVTA